MQDRRHFLKAGFSLAGAGLAGGAALTRARRSLATEAPPETTSLRLAKIDGTCLAPFDILGDVLGDEGFADVRYVPVKDTDIPVERVASGHMDFAMDFGASSCAQGG